MILRELFGMYIVFIHTLVDIVFTRSNEIISDTYCKNEHFFVELPQAKISRWIKRKENSRTHCEVPFLCSFHTNTFVPSPLPSQGSIAEYPLLFSPRSPFTSQEAAKRTVSAAPVKRPCVLSSLTQNNNGNNG